MDVVAEHGLIGAVRAELGRRSLPGGHDTRGTGSSSRPAPVPPTRRPALSSRRRARSADCPALGAAAELRLARRARAGDTAAEREMVEANLGLVRAIARGYANQGAPFADLMQEGTVGLMRAVRGYDPDRGVRFSSYAGWWIRRSVLNALGAARVIRIPSHAAHDLATIRRAERDLERDGLRNAPAETIAARTGLPAPTVRTLRAAPRVTASLEQPVGEHARPLGELIGDPRSADPLETLAREQRREQLSRMLRVLPLRQRQVLVRRYGLSGGAPQSHREIGGHLGVKEERSRQLEHEALRRLRELTAAGAQAAYELL
jgi:RNA polymerase primary sigma factor